MIRKILALVSLVGLITMALVAYSLTSSVSETQDAVNDSKHQLTAKVKEIVAPAFQKFGIDIEKVNVDDMNIVKRKIEDASDALGEASAKITQ